MGIAPGPLRPITRDAAVAGVLLVVALAMGSSHAHALRTAGPGIEPGSFNQRVFAAALMAACGRGLTTPTAALLPGSGEGQPLDAVREFLLGRREAIACEELPGDLAADGLDGLQRASRYLLLSVSWAWTLAGPAWWAIDGLMGVMFAASIGFAYFTCRLAMGRVAAGVVAVLLMISPLHLRNLADVRDYSKAPFFLLCLCAVGVLATRALTWRQTVSVATLTGLLLGFGFGMRTDVLVNVLIVMTVLVAFLPGPLAETWRTRAAAAAACAIAFALMAWPLTGSFETRSSPWHVALLGFAQDWNYALDVSATPYETGHFYNDSYVGTIVDAYWGGQGHGDARVSVGLPHYGEASRSYYLAILTMFPADALIRGWASLIKVLELPFSGMAAVPGELLPRGLAVVMRAVQSLLARIEFASVPLFALTLIGVSLGSVRLAALLFLLAVSLGTYPSIQFQARHLFHLEVVSLWTSGLAVSWAVHTTAGFARGRAGVMPAGARLRPPVIFAAVVIAIVLVPLAAARAYQQRAVSALLQSYEDAPLVPAGRMETPAANGLVRIADGDGVLPRPRGARSMYGDLLAVDVAGECGPAFTSVTFRYAANNSSADFTRTLELDVPARGATTRIFFPAFESGAASPDADRLAFSGIEVPAAEAACITRVSRLAEPDRLPLLLNAVLAGDWRNRPLYQRLRRWEGDPSADAPRSRSYWSPPALRTEGAALFARGATAAGYRWPVDYNAKGAFVRDDTVVVKGFSQAPGSYLVSWQPRPLEAASVVLIEGRLERGGLTVGLADGSGWIASIDIDRPGAFRAGVQVPSSGRYQLVVANHLPDGSLANRFTISRIALVSGGS